MNNKRSKGIRGIDDEDAVYVCKYGHETPESAMIDHWGHVNLNYCPQCATAVEKRKKGEEEDE